MLTTLNFKDLALRILAIFLTSIILLFVTHDDNFDLHFKIRKPQKTSDQVLIIEVGELHQVQDAVSSLAARHPALILVNSDLFDASGELVRPYSLTNEKLNPLFFQFPTDTDGLTRKVRIKSSRSMGPLPLKHSGKINVINFRGPGGSFPSLNYFDLKNDEVLFDDQILILASPANSDFTTPLGVIGETEMIANVVDNWMEGRFLFQKSFGLPIAILALILLFTTALLIFLPSTLALVISIAIAITYISGSLWIFDTYSLWTPILIPVVQLFLTFLLISNYKFALNEKTRWSLEKENLFFDQVEEMKTNFLSLFSHDLKTPLSKIIGISDTLKSQVKDADVLMEITKIHSASKDLEKYIKRILKMSQVQSKNISLDKSPQDINQLIERSIDQNKELAADKKIKIQKNLTPLFMVDMDGPLIQEVIINFIENAITYSPENSQITVSSLEVNDFIKVSVKDQGKGIPKQAQESIWEKYYRFDSNQAGYGLGLFLSRYVIHLHKGQVFLNSKEVGGSEFGFLLPIDEEDL